MWKRKQTRGGSCALNATNTQGSHPTRHMNSYTFYVDDTLDGVRGVRGWECRMTWRMSKSWSVKETGATTEQHYTRGVKGSETLRPLKTNKHHWRLSKFCRPLNAGLFDVSPRAREAGSPSGDMWLMIMRQWRPQELGSCNYSYERPSSSSRRKNVGLWRATEFSIV